AGMGGAGGAGGGSACTGTEATIYQVNNDPAAAGGPIGNKVAVHLKGVVAMSQKFLVTKSNAGRCLWGVFVSAPDVVGATTKEYSGVMVVSRGTDAVADPDGTTYCPKLGVVGETPGDAIPDDVKRGDVLNVIGMTDYFLLNNCAGEVNGSKVPQRQVSNSCLVEKTGDTVKPPDPHVFTDAADILELTSPTNKDFHDKWGNVKVRVEGQFAAVPQMVNNKPSVITQFGEVVLEGSNLAIGDKIYYRGYLKATNACHDGPKFTVPMNGPYMFDAFEGFGYLNYCTWGLQANNKCLDYSPASEDCAAGGPGGTPLMCP
ncbi:MAG: hypothetical protein HUU21_20625, partial [Polyangiaceae bacterium]|nr:hypothetical protein [Polyangiaceae bacterium]